MAAFAQEPARYVPAARDGPYGAAAGGVSVVDDARRAQRIDAARGAYCVAVGVVARSSGGDAVALPAALADAAARFSAAGDAEARVVHWAFPSALAAQQFAAGVSRGSAAPAESQFAAATGRRRLDAARIQLYYAAGRHFAAAAHASGAVDARAAWIVARAVPADSPLVALTPARTLVALRPGEPPILTPAAAGDAAVFASVRAAAEAAGAARRAAPRATGPGADGAPPLSLPVYFDAACVYEDVTGGRPALPWARRAAVRAALVAAAAELKNAPSAAATAVVPSAATAGFASAVATDLVGAAARADAELTFDYVG